MKIQALLALFLIILPTANAQNMTAEDHAFIQDEMAAQRAFIEDHMAGLLKRMIQVEQATLTVLERLEAIEAQAALDAETNAAMLQQVKAVAEETRTAAEQVEDIRTEVATLSLLPDQVAAASTGVKEYIRDAVDLARIQSEMQAQDEAIEDLEAKAGFLTNLNLLLAALVAALVAMEAHRRWQARTPKPAQATPPGNDEDDEDEALEASIALRKDSLASGWDAPNPAVAPDPGPSLNGVHKRNGVVHAEPVVPVKPDPDDATAELATEATPEEVVQVAAKEPVVKVVPKEDLVGVCGACFTDSGPCQSEGHCMLSATA